MSRPLPDLDAPREKTDHFGADGKPADIAQTITGEPAGLLKMARLVNFPTGKAENRFAHKDWLVREVEPLLQTRRPCWVDIIGHTSRLGDAAKNNALSERRCNATFRVLEDRGRSFGYPVDAHLRLFKGERDAEDRGVRDGDNAGYDRAVEVFVYGGPKPKVPPEPPKPVRVGSTNWKMCIDVLIAGGVHVVAGAMVELMRLTLVDRDRNVKRHFAYAGVSGGYVSPVTLALWLKGLISSGRIFGPAVSIGGLGPFTDFTTSGPALLSDFEGEARVLSKSSLGGWVPHHEVYMRIDSATLKKKKATVVGGKVHMRTKVGAAFTLAGGAGYLMAM
jgi:hypothetical protein